MGKTVSFFIWSDFEIVIAMLQNSSLVFVKVVQAMKNLNGKQLNLHVIIICA